MKCQYQMLPSRLLVSKDLTGRWLDMCDCTVSMEIISFFWTSAEIWKQIPFKAWLFRIPDIQI